MGEAIPDYNIKALKSNIAKLGQEIKTFKEIAKKSERENRWEQAEIFHRATMKAETEINELEKYIDLIEARCRGNPV